MRPRSSVVLLTASALLFLCSVARAQLSPKIHYIDVGSSDAILLELNRAAVFIDAGSDRSYDAGAPYRLVSYLKAFFNRRPELNSTIDSIIISTSQPALSLREVVRTFKVKSLIDSGQSSSQLDAARNWIKNDGGQYYRVNQSTTRALLYSNPALEAIEATEPGLHFQLITNYLEGCRDESGSMMVGMVYDDSRFLFAGDIDPADFNFPARCRASVQQHFDFLYNNTELLETQVYKVEGTLSANSRWLRVLKPKIAVISIGRESGRTISNRGASAYPVDDTVRLLESMPTLEPRPARMVPTADRRSTIKPRALNKAIYCTCWDGDIVIDAKTLKVQTSSATLDPQKKELSKSANPPPSPPPLDQPLADFDGLSVARQKEILSANGPQLPQTYLMGNIQMRGFIKGGWPFFVSYSLTKGTAVLTISANNVEPFIKELAPGLQQQVVVTAPQRFGNELTVASISIEAKGSPNNLDQPVFEIHAMGILEAQRGDANHPRWRIPAPIDLPIADIKVDKDRIVTSRNEKVLFSFYSRSPYTSGAAEFFRFTFDPEQGVIAERVFTSPYDDIKANRQTDQREWDGKDWQRAVSLGTHRLQIRTWRGQQKGGIWFGPYYGPQLQVVLQ